MYREANGDHRGAIENIDAMFSISDHLRSESFYNSFFYAGLIDLRAIAAFHRVLASGRVSYSDMALLRISDNPSYHVLLKRAFLMYEAMDLDEFKQIYEGKEETFFYALGYNSSSYLTPWRFATVYRVLLFNADLAAYRRLAPERECIAEGASYRETRDIVVAFDERASAEPDAVLAVTLRQQLTLSVVELVKADARRRLARLGLALYRYRAQKGRYPDKLDDLQPDFIFVVPGDPFDDKPLRLKQTDHGLIVYSIGPDMTDNGGEPIDETQKTETGDIVFELPK